MGMWDDFTTGIKALIPGTEENEYLDDAVDMMVDDVREDATILRDGITSGDLIDYFTSGDAAYDLGEKIVTTATGHDFAAEYQLMANIDKVDLVQKTLQNIKTNTVENGRNAVREALVDLNNVPGLNENVMVINTNGLDWVFDDISSNITNIQNMLASNVESIVNYNNAPGWEKTLSSIGMLGTKFGEGALSVFEDVDDALVTSVGWSTSGLLNLAGLGLDAIGLDSAANKVYGASNSVSNFTAGVVSQDVVHDLANKYYNSDLAQYSTFTEDSLVANASYFCGSTASFLLLAGVSAGVAEGVTGANQLVIHGVHLGSTSTLSATGLAAATGLGSGTESGLNSGLSLNQSVARGALRGAGQALLAYGAGRYSEYAQSTRAVRDAEMRLEEARTNLQEAYEAAGIQKPNLENLGENVDVNLLDDYNNYLAKLNKLSPEQYSELSSLESAVRGAERNLENVRSAVYQGYNDSLTNFGRDSGRTFVENVQNIPENMSNFITNIRPTSGSTASAANENLEVLNTSTSSNTTSTTNNVNTSSNTPSNYEYNIDDIDINLTDGYSRPNTSSSTATSTTNNVNTSSNTPSNYEYNIDDINTNLTDGYSRPNTSSSTATSSTPTSTVEQPVNTPAASSTTSSTMTSSTASSSSSSASTSRTFAEQYADSRALINDEANNFRNFLRRTNQSTAAFDSAYNNYNNAYNDLIDAMNNFSATRGRPANGIDLLTNDSLKTLFHNYSIAESAIKSNMSYF